MSSKRERCSNISTKCQLNDQTECKKTKHLQDPSSSSLAPPEFQSVNQFERGLSKAWQSSVAAREGEALRAIGGPHEHDDTPPSDQQQSDKTEIDSDSIAQVAASTLQNLASNRAVDTRRQRVENPRPTSAVNLPQQPKSPAPSSTPASSTKETSALVDHVSAKKLLAQLLTGNNKQIIDCLRELHRLFDHAPSAHFLRQHLHQFGGAHILLDLLSPITHPFEVCVCAASILRMFATNSDHNTTLVGKLGAISKVLGLLFFCSQERANVPTQFIRCAADTLQRLLVKHGRNQLLCVQAGGLNTLFALMRRLFNSPVKQQPCNAANPLVTISNILWMCCTSVQIEFLESFFLSSSPTATTSSTMTDDQQNETPVCDTLIEMLTSKLPCVQTATAGVIGSLAVSSVKISRQLASRNVLSILIDIIKDEKSKQETAQWAMFAVGSMAHECSSNVDELHRLNALPLIVRSLQLTPQSKSSPLSQNNPSSEPFSVADESMQRVALCALRNCVMSASSSVTETLTQFDLSQQLVTLLSKSTNPLIQTASASAIGAFADMSNACVQQLLAADVLPSLVAHMQSAETQVRKAATIALLRCVVNDPNICKSVGKHRSSIPALVSLLDACCMEVQSCACTLICSMASCHEQLSREIGLHDGVSKLVQMLFKSNISQSLKLRVIAALGGCARNSVQNRDAIYSMGGVFELIRILQNPKELALHPVVLTTLERMMCSQKVQQACMQRGALVEFVRCLRSCDPKTKKHAAMAIHSVSKDNKAMAKALAKLGVVEQLSKLLIDNLNS